MAASRPEKIFQIPRSDASSQCVIVHVKPSAATIELNIKIVVTDGESHYSIDFKENKVGRFKDAAANQSEEDWKAALRACFLVDARDEDTIWKTKVEMTSTVTDDEVVIEIRQDINGIKQKLGQINVPANEGEIELWGWLVEVCKEKDDVQRKVLLAEQQTKKEEDIIAKLTKQLDDLIKAKKEHEEALILRFQKLLNEKKREYRLHSSALNNAASPPDEHASNKKGKRKAKAAELASGDEMEVDPVESEEEEAVEQRSDRETTSGEETEAEEVEDSFVMLKNRQKARDESVGDEDDDDIASRKGIRKVIRGKAKGKSKPPPKQKKNEEVRMEIDTNSGEETPSDDEL